MIDRTDPRQVTNLLVRIDKNVATEIQHRAAKQGKAYAEVVEDAIRTPAPLKVWHVSCPEDSWWAYVLAPTQEEALETLIEHHYQTEDTVEELCLTPVTPDDAARIQAPSGSLAHLWLQAIHSGSPSLVSITSEDRNA